MNENFFDILSGNPYPGRGIMLGKTDDGKKSVVVYFIMGRSENSRNRVFERTEDGIRTRAFDESKMTDPSLIIYHPVRKLGDDLIVTNGDQTDTICSFLKEGRVFAEPLRTRCFEPDCPNYTPRISGILHADGSYALSILKSADGDPSSTRRYFFGYENPLAGQGHFIHTYQENAEPLPSFRGEPRQVSVGNDDINTFVDKVWNALNSDNKVSLFVQFTEISSGESQSLIINKNGEE